MFTFCNQKSCEMFAHSSLVLQILQFGHNLIFKRILLPQSTVVNQKLGSLLQPRP